MSNLKVLFSHSWLVSGRMIEISGEVGVNEAATEELRQGSSR
jgi:hypothetical protein